MSAIILSSNLSIGAVNDFVDRAVHEGVTKEHNLPALMRSFANKLVHNTFDYTVEIASSSEAVDKLNKIIKRWKSIDPEACLKLKDVFSKILKDGAVLANLCEECSVKVQKYKEFIKPFVDKVNNISRFSQKTPVTTAVEAGDINMLHLLAKLGADFDKSDGNGNSPLTLAIDKRDSKIIKLLVGLGADLNKPDKNQYFPVHRAISKNNSEMVKELKLLGANLDIDSQEIFTPLMYAVKLDDIDMVGLLLDLNANIDKAKWDGKTLLIYAIENKKYPMIEFLIKHGVRINESDPQGYTALDYAVKERDMKMAHFLKSLGADLNCINVKGQTPLTKAIFAGDERGVELLLDLGADIEKANNDGYTPLAYAKIHNRSQIIENLKLSGADEDSANNFLKIKFLAHVWGIGGTTELTNKDGVKKTIRLEGFYSGYVMKKLESYMSEFFQTEEFSSFSLGDATKREIQEAIHNCHIEGDNTDLVEAAWKVRKGDPFIMMGGAKDHAVALVLHQNKLFLCNRGHGSDAAVAIYDLPASQVFDELLSYLAHDYDSVESFNKMLLAINFRRVGSYRLKDQKAGNCTWASAKAAFAVLCRLYTNDDMGKKSIKHSQDL